MVVNRCIPDAVVIPVLVYPDANLAAAWLCDAFGFAVRVRFGTHRVQMNVGYQSRTGAVILREPRPAEIDAKFGVGHSITVRVEDADAHCQRAREHGARITSEPANYPYGERQYVAEDFAGYSWTFSQSVADVDPEEWSRAVD